MRYITFVFSRSKKKFPIFGWAIQRFLGMKISHVSIHFFSDSLSRDLVYEAVSPYTRFVGKIKWEEIAEPVYQFKIPVTQEQYTKILQNCVDLSGMKYGFMQNIGIVIAKLFKLNKNPIKKSNQQIICSEIGAEVLEIIGIKINKDIELIDPKDIYLALVEKYG